MRLLLLLLRPQTWPFLRATYFLQHELLLSALRSEIPFTRVAFTILPAALH